MASRIGMLAGALATAYQQVLDGAGADRVEAIDLALREGVARARRQAADHVLPLVELLQGHHRVEDALVGAEREQRPLDDTLDEAIAIGITVLEHRADQSPAIALLGGVEARLPVDVTERARRVAHDELHRDVVVVR